MLAYTRGRAAPEPCENYRHEKRPFKMCILFDGQLGEKCANCYFGRSERGYALECSNAPESILH
jgi:Protein of unknown function (DUF3716)